MSFNDLELKKYELITKKFIEKHRPPVNIRNEVDLSFRIDGYSVEIFEIRPFWKDKSRNIEEHIAKVKYIKSKNIWKIYWQKSDLKWHSYDPEPEVNSLDEFLKIVDEDKFACFWG